MTQRPFEWASPRVSSFHHRLFWFPSLLIFTDCLFFLSTHELAQAMKYLEPHWNRSHSISNPMPVFWNSPPSSISFLVFSLLPLIRFLRHSFNIRVKCFFISFPFFFLLVFLLSRLLPIKEAPDDKITATTVFLWRGNHYGKQQRQRKPLHFPSWKSKTKRMPEKKNIKVKPFRWL